MPTSLTSNPKKYSYFILLIPVKQCAFGGDLQKPTLSASIPAPDEWWLKVKVNGQLLFMHFNSNNILQQSECNSTNESLSSNKVDIKGICQMYKDAVFSLNCFVLEIVTFL